MFFINAVYFIWTRGQKNGHGEDNDKPSVETNSPTKKNEVMSRSGALTPGLELVCLSTSASGCEAHVSKIRILCTARDHKIHMMEF